MASVMYFLNHFGWHPFLSRHLMLRYNVRFKRHQRLVDPGAVMLRERGILRDQMNAHTDQNASYPSGRRKRQPAGAGSCCKTSGWIVLRSLSKDCALEAPVHRPYTNFRFMSKSERINLQYILYTESHKNKPLLKRANLGSVNVYTCIYVL